jgi:hypothetical protein
MMLKHRTPNSSSQSDGMKVTGVGNATEQMMGRARDPSKSGRTVVHWRGDET